MDPARVWPPCLLHRIDLREITRYQAEWEKQTGLELAWKFVTKHNAYLKAKGTFTFTDNIHSDESIWLRLNDKTKKKYALMGMITLKSSVSFDQQYGKSLLISMDFNAEDNINWPE